MALSIFLDNRASDLRWAIRAIRRAPGTSILAILSLALGIGANTAIFSLVNAVLLKTLPVPSPQELYLVASNRSDPRVSWNYPDYIAFRDGGRGFSGLAAASGVSSTGAQLGEGGGAELVHSQFVSGNYFEVLGASPALGRLFNAGDDRFNASAWAVLSHEFWRSRFAGDPRVVGRTVRLNGYPLTIVGVTRPGFKGIDPTALPTVFVPMVMHTEIQHVPAAMWNSRHWWWFRIVGRLPRGTAVQPVESQLTAIYRAQEEAERKVNPRAGQANRSQAIVLLPAARGWSFVRNVLQAPLLVLMAVVGFVLLIACANVANIMLARGAARRREIAVRLAIGAGRRRIASQLVTESLVIALAGGLCGVGLAYAGTGAILGQLLSTAAWQEVTLDVSTDLAVLAFTVIVSVLTGVLAGAAPALQATRPDLVTALKDELPGRGARSRVLLRRLLVVAQVALSLLLVIGSALFVRSLANLRTLDAGFRREQTLMVFVDPGRAGIKGQRLRDLLERLRQDVERLPGVRSASLAAITPLGGMRWNGDFAVEGYQFKAGDRHYVDMNAVGPRYFETVGISLLVGRDFTEADNPAVTPDPPERLSLHPGDEPELPGPRVVIATEAFAKKFLAGSSPIGRHVSLTEEFDPSKAYEVVGVVKDAHYFGLKEATEPMLYVPSWRTGGGMGSRTLCVRTSGAAGLVDAIRAALRGIDPAVPLISAKTMEDQVDNDIVRERLMATLAGCFGALALLLACVGLYGVISYLVTQRTREIGIRLALGAPRARVLGLVAGDALLLVGIGAAAGIAAAAAVSRLVRSLLYGISPNDPATVAMAVGVLLAVSAMAVLVPVRRALAVEPSEALRYE